MDALTLYSSLMLAAYAIILLGLGYWAYRQENHAGYVIGNRNIGLFTTLCSLLAGQFNGGGVFLTFFFAMTIGFGGLLGGLGFTIGYFIIACFAKKIRTDSEKYGDVTVPDFINRYIGTMSHKFTTFIITGKAVLFGTAQLLIAGSVVALVLDIDKTWGIIGTTSLIAIYMFLGGYLTVVKTDVVQWCLLFIIATIGLFFIPLPSTEKLTSDIINTPISILSGLFFFTLILILSNADVWQRIMSASSVSTSKKSLIYSGITYFIFLFVILALWIFWKDNGDIEPTKNFFSLFENQTLSPFVIASIGCFTLISVMSTIDTQVYLFTSAIAKNAIGLNIQTDRIRYVRITRILTLALLLTMAVTAIFAGSTLDFILKAFSFAYILAPIIMMSVLSKQSNRYKDFLCIIALLIGLAVYLYMFFAIEKTTLIEQCIPSAITALICICGYGLYHIKSLPRKNQQSL